LVLACAGALALRSWLRSRADLDLLARLRTPSALRIEYDELWPPTPDKLQAFDAWLPAAESLRAQRERYRGELEDLRARALPFDAAAPLETRARRSNETRLHRAEE